MHVGASSRKSRVPPQYRQVRAQIRRFNAPAAFRKLVMDQVWRFQMPVRSAPTKLKVLKGEKPSRINQNEPQPGLLAKSPAVPTWLAPDAKKLWRRLAPQLWAKGLLSDWDLEPFALYCEAVVHHREACRIVAEEGVVITDAKGHGVKHPALQVVRDQAAIIRGYAQEFGLTPSARSGITMPDTVEFDEARRLLS